MYTPNSIRFLPTPVDLNTGQNYCQQLHHHEDVDRRTLTGIRQTVISEMISSCAALVRGSGYTGRRGLDRLETMRSVKKGGGGGGTPLIHAQALIHAHPHTNHKQNNKHRHEHIRAHARTHKYRITQTGLTLLALSLAAHMSPDDRPTSLPPCNTPRHRWDYGKASKDVPQVSPVPLLPNKSRNLNVQINSAVRATPMLIWHHTGRSSMHARSRRQLCLFLSRL